MRSTILSYDGMELEQNRTVTKRIFHYRLTSIFVKNPKEKYGGGKL